MSSFYDLKAKTIDGEDFEFSSLRGKKVLIVNTASACGLTPQYMNLQEVYDDLGGDRFEILGFPSNDFGGQEPGTDEWIEDFCTKNYGVTFQMMSKITVKGDDVHPVYQWLTKKELNGVGDHNIEWNFHKFLIDRDGHLHQSLDPLMSPIDAMITEWIEEE